MDKEPLNSYYVAKLPVGQAEHDGALCTACVDAMRDSLVGRTAGRGAREHVGFAGAGSRGGVAFFLTYAGDSREGL